ncbi:MAG: RsmB/NOP family class I SAM-dependent RNA methyltransferase [Alphaproteobacteria bacterium]|nr:MAG: RsmB/NOP family class I SAM-dependent RNA methyltransferase [Alphaproteobacteria bacterium]
MRPGPRVQTAIDLLIELAEGDRPAEQLLRNWARKNRYAGSKDRAAIGDLVFEISRHKGRYAFLMGSWEPRALMLAHLAEQGPADWRSWFDGTAHAPLPVTDLEEEQLQNRPTQLPGFAMFSVPEDWMNEIEATFGEETDVELEAMLSRAPIDLRVNTLKSARKPARVHLAREGIETQPLELSAHALRIEATAEIAPRQITSSETFKKGEVELQDLGSIWIVDRLTVKPGDTVVDLCAGGGGKTLGLAAAMKNKGSLIACDISPERLANIKPRLKRAGATNVDLRLISAFTTSDDTPDPVLGDLSGKADLVLVDAPCSGTGTWRRHPDAKWRLTPEALDRYLKTQSELLDRAAKLVRPGGSLAYVTCSILNCENEAQIAQFLEAHNNFKPREIDSNAAVRKSSRGYQLSPNTTGCDGFYVAFLKRAG